jgi:hypothetical protein
MTYLLDDKIKRADDNLRLWEQILRPLDRRPLSPQMRKAVVSYEIDRRRARDRRSA